MNGSVCAFAIMAAAPPADHQVVFDSKAGGVHALIFRESGGAVFATRYMDASGMTANHEGRNSSSNWYEKGPLPGTLRVLGAAVMDVGGDARLRLFQMR